MTAYAGNSGIVAVGTTSTVTAVGEVRSFSIEESADTIEVTAMGSTHREYVPSFTTGTVSIDALFDTENIGANGGDDSNQDHFDVGDTLFFQVQPTGATGENYSGSGIVTSKTVTASYDGLVEASFSLQLNSAVVVAT